MKVPRKVALWAVTSLACLAGMSSIAATARADADPASDVLLGTAAFFPYQPAVAQGLQNQLLAELGRLRRRGLNLKVAVIESPVDLGAIPNMFGHPQAYAEFLEREISFNQPQPLLVVMPAGFGLSHAERPSALGTLRVDNTRRSNSLTESAILAVQRIAAGVGKKVATGRAEPARGSGGGTSPVILFVAPVILVVLGALLAARLHRAPRQRP
jgi:hypothetical protein